MVAALLRQCDGVKDVRFIFLCSRLLSMGIIVALDQHPMYEAKGSLFWDDGVSFGNASCIAETFAIALLSSGIRNIHFLGYQVSD